MAATKKTHALAEERTFDDAEALAKSDSDAPPPSAPTAEAEPSLPPSPVAPIPSRAEKKAAVAPPAPALVTSALFRVWAYGTLRRNGKTYKPGATLSLPVDVGDAIACLARVTVDDDT